MNASSNFWWEGIVSGLRWPAAILSLLALPFLLVVWWHLLPQFLYHWFRSGAMIAGGVAYWYFWRPFSLRLKIGDRAVAGETMITRGTVRWITHCTGEKSNWMVVVAPYCIPTAAILLALFAAMVPIPLVPWSSLALGFALAYHARALRVVYRTNPRELQKLGWVWVALFLPGANLLGLSLLVAMGLEGVSLVSAIFSDALSTFTGSSAT